MRIDKDPAKERANLRKHKVTFSLADIVCADQAAITVYDRYENGEDRWHTFGFVGNTLFLVVHSYPDPENDEWIRVIGLRRATATERKRYEEAALR